MIELLIGIITISLFLVFIYLLGMIFILFKESIDFKNITLLTSKGFTLFLKILISCIVLIFVYGLGLFIKHLITTWT